MCTRTLGGATYRPDTTEPLEDVRRFSAGEIHVAEELISFQV